MVGIGDAVFGYGMHFLGHGLWSRIWIAFVAGCRDSGHHFLIVHVQHDHAPCQLRESKCQATCECLWLNESRIASAAHRAAERLSVHSSIQKAEKRFRQENDFCSLSLGRMGATGCSLLR